MDLRVQKTRSSIKCIFMNAFIELLSQKPIEKITIRELADTALISKATFYLHFKDIYDLSEYLENELLESIIKDIPHPEYLITAPKEGIREITTSFSAHSQLANILFPRNRKTLLLERLEPKLKELIFKKFPEYKNHLEAEILLTVLIQGDFHAYAQFSESNFDETVDVLGRISECLISNF